MTNLLVPFFLFFRWELSVLTRLGVTWVRYCLGLLEFTGSSLEVHWGCLNNWI